MWQHHQMIGALREYVLVSQSEPRIEIYRRLESGAWSYGVSTSGEVRLATGAVLDLATLYADLPD